MSSRGYVLKTTTGASCCTTDYQLLEEQTLAAAATTYDMTTTLNGDTDGGYIFHGYIDSDATTAPNIVLRINGADWAITRSTFIQTGGGVAAATNTTTTLIGLQATSGTTYKGEFRVFIPFSKSGYERMASVIGTHSGNTVATIEQVRYECRITTPAAATNITSIGVSSSQTDGLGIGSKFRLYRLTNN